MTRRLLPSLALLLLVAGHPAPRAIQRWQILPPTPAPVPGEQVGHARVNGISLYYATIGHADPGRVPVVLLHGGLANSDYWGNQVRALMAHHLVILVDSRGHGRSTRDAQPFGYDLMTDDVVALLSQLNLPRVDVVGWSDGAILALDMAMRHPDRVRRIVAFAANTKVIGVKPDVADNPTFAAFIKRAGVEYRKLSPTPQGYADFVRQISHMWDSQPNWTDAQLRQITVPVLIMDGDHDEAIKRAHTDYIAATIPGASLVILPDTSHFAFLQAPKLFDAAVIGFLDK